VGDGSVPVPERYSRVDPWVISSDTEAEIAFLEAAFGARETPGSRMLGPDGRIGHVEVELGTSVVMLFDAQTDWPALPSHLRVYVADTQATVERAIAARARVVTQPTDLAFGERVARVRDPQGHLWWIHQRIEEVDGDELRARFADPAAQQAMACEPAPRIRSSDTSRRSRHPAQLRLEPVAHAADARDPVLAQLLAQVADVDVDDVRAWVVVVAPHVAEELLTR
jgi:PhnB protein